MHGSVQGACDCGLVVPKNPTELHSFLGVANFYKRFIDGYSRIAALLSDLLRKIEVWCWSAEHQTTFCKLKRRLITEPRAGLARL